MRAACQVEAGCTWPSRASHRRMNRASSERIDHGIEENSRRRRLTGRPALIGVGNNECLQVEQSPHSRTSPAVDLGYSRYGHTALSFASIAASRQTSALTTLGRSAVDRVQDLAHLSVHSRLCAAVLLVGAPAFLLCSCARIVLRSVFFNAISTDSSIFFK